MVDRLNEARAAGEDLSPILREVGDRMQLPASTVQQWISQAGAVSDADQRSNQIADTLRVLTGVTQDNTTATNANNVAKAGMSSAGQTYRKRCRSSWLACRTTAMPPRRLIASLRKTST